MLDEKRIQEIKERAEKATKGCLRLTRYEHGGGRLHTADNKKLIAAFYSADDREFYGVARADIPFLLKTIEDLRSAEQGGWIAVESETPKGHETVLVYTETGSRLVGWHHMTNKRWYTYYTKDGRFVEQDVTHWRPLPAPPAAPKKSEDVAGQEKERC